jgi:ankyrin repeat protein
VNAKDDKGRTPLQRAAREGHKEVAELLIAAGAALNWKDKEGKTPLYHAARWGHTNIAALLIAAGADVNAKDDKGRTPLDRAVGYTETVALLREHGGRTAQELKALMPHLEYGKDKLTIPTFSNNVLFDFRFITKAGKSYTVEATGDLLKWNKVETIRGTGSKVKFTDTRKALFERQYYRVKVVD